MSAETPTTMMSAHDHGNCQLCDDLEKERARLDVLVGKLIQGKECHGLLWHFAGPCPEGDPSPCVVCQLGKKDAEIARLDALVRHAKIVR